MVSKGKVGIFSLHLFSDLYGTCTISLYHLSISQMINFRLFQTKRVADINFTFNGNGGKCPEKIENIVGKGEITYFE